MVTNSTVLVRLEPPTPEELGVCDLVLMKVIWGGLSQFFSKNNYNHHQQIMDGLKERN